MRRPGPYLLLAAVCAALFCAVAAGVQTERLIAFDEAVRMGVHGLASPLLTQIALKATWLGSVGVLIVFLAAVVAALTLARRRSEAMFFAATMAGALALENALKFGFRRVRPPAFFGSEPETYSFPSGHSLLSLCFYASLAVLASRRTRSPALKAGIWIGTILLVLAIGATRIYLGVHYPSDVLGGYLVAVAWIAIVLRAGPRRRS